MQAGGSTHYRLAFGVVAWAAALIVGLSTVWTYSMTPGTDAPHPSTWPAESRLPRAVAVPSLVMFVHPRCTCTRASLVELEAILRQARRPVATTVVFLRPSGADASWDQAPEWRAAARLDHVELRVDWDGEEAHRFGAMTSGQVLLYDATGALRFAGGITGSRGHEGDNLGRRRVLALIDGGATDARDGHVFGCPLHDATGGAL